MKCLQCGAEMKAGRENYRDTSSGLSYVTLLDVEVNRCPACGEFEVVVPHVEELHRLMARDVATKKTRLTPEEIRFLRKHLGWSGADFARKLGVARETVSRWESGAQEMASHAEAVLRVWVTMFEPDRDYTREVLGHLADLEPSRNRRLEAKARDESWSLDEVSTTLAAPEPQG